MDKLMAYIKMKVAMLDYAITNDPADDSKIMCIVRNIEDAIVTLKDYIIESRR